MRTSSRRAERRPTRGLALVAPAKAGSSRIESISIFRHTRLRPAMAVGTEARGTSSSTKSG